MNFHLHLDSEAVKHIGYANHESVAPQTPIAEAMQTLRGITGGSLFVCDGDILLGIFTERDALRLAALGQSLEGPIEKYMTANPITIHPDETVGGAIRRMSEGGYRHLPVVDGNDQVLGVLRVGDILHYLVDHFPKTVYTLPPNPRHVTKAREGA